MVGAPSSNRCGTCKARKVKCDEAWPICGPCERGNRHCPGPPKPRIKFVDHQRHGFAATDSVQPVEQQHVNRASGTQDDDLLTTATNLHMITLSSSEVDGCMVQKIRLINTSNTSTSYRTPPLTRSLSLSPGEVLARRLYPLINRGKYMKGTAVHVHGMWFHELPRRFGSSTVLDDAALCLISSHETVARGGNPETWMDFKQYGKALRSLQRALNDPAERLSTNTLASVALLWRLEGIFATANREPPNTQPVHAKALSHMLEARGFQNMEDPFEFFLNVDCCVAAVQDYLSREIPQPCPFESEEWGLVLDKLDHITPISKLYWRTYMEYTKWPGLIHDLTVLYLSPEDIETTLTSVLHRAFSVARELEASWSLMEDILRDPKVCIIKESSTHDPLVPLVFEFQDTELAPLLGYFCSYSLIIHRMVIHVSSLLASYRNTAPSLHSMPALPTTFPISEEYEIPALFSSTDHPTSPLPRSFIQDLRARNVQLAQLVWMMYEQTRQWKPVGCLFFLNALKISFPWAGSQEMRDWILNAGTDIEDFLPNTTRWVPERLERFCSMLSGEDVPIDEDF